MIQNALNPVQRAAVELIESDLKLIFTIMKNINMIESNYIIMFLPYMGVIVDGAEDWIKSYNNSSKDKIQAPLFNSEEQEFYEELRSSIKLWQANYSEIYTLLQEAYKTSEHYFSNTCKPIAKKLKLYDIFGVDRANGAICGNTILCYCYTPKFSFSGENGDYIKRMAEVAGKYVVTFNALEDFGVHKGIKFDSWDYGGFQKSPVGNTFSNKFVLFSILCQINFLLYGIEKWILEEIPAKLRFSYLLYYSLLDIIPVINNSFGICLKVDDKWRSDYFRNAMAHYKMGVALKSEELICDDLLFGLTQKYFNCKYLQVKEAILHELEMLANQIGVYLKLNDKMVKGEF